MTRSILCDLERQSYLQIPNDLYRILTDHRGKSVAEIKAFYGNRYDATIEDYFARLSNAEFVFATDHPELFPVLDSSWDEPFELTNAIIDIDNKSTFELESIFYQLSSLHCKFIQIRFFKSAQIEEMGSIIDFLNSMRSNSIGLELLVGYNELSTEADYLLLFKKYKRLNSLIVYGMPGGKVIKRIEHSRYLVFTPVDLSSEHHCGHISKELFSINIKTFTEALNFNSCLNGKISIDKRGEIKNCPSMTSSFGNIKDTKLSQVLLHPGYKKNWKITKDQVHTCKSCEFRYICTDCRAYVQHPDGDGLSKPLKCGYDPQIGEWTDWSINPLNQAAYRHYFGEISLQ